MATRRILIVDDNEPLRALLRTYLVDAGYETVEASDGEAAIRLALFEQLDLVLLDVILPDAAASTCCAKSACDETFPSS
jgi:DNA-binding response OmpR family regulator